MLALMTTSTVTGSAFTPSIHRASQLAIGEWEIDLKCNRDTYESVLFPHQQATAPSTLVPRLTWDMARQYPLRLCVFSDGTFRLEPRGSGAELLRHHKDTTYLSSIQGKWQAQPNPYCATDRFYDELVFCSHSRVERQLLTGGLFWRSTNKRNQATVLKKIQFRLNCRLHGQYWSSGGALASFIVPANNKEQKYIKGKMTHGVLVADHLDGADKPAQWWRRRVVSGSFAGRRRRQLIEDDDDLETIK
jgi:hypothetical protein